MPTTAADILESFPEFVDAEGKEFYLELAEADQADLWGDVRYQWAIAFRAAHMMEGAGLGSAGVSGTGGVTSKHIGSLSVSYATPSGGGATAGTLDNTRYGRLLQELLAGAVVPIMVNEGWSIYGADCGWSTSTGFWHHGPWWSPWGRVGWFW